MVEFCQQDVQVAQGKQDNIRCVAQLQALARGPAVDELA